MNILALDTSSTACSVALAIGGRIFSRHEIASLQQAQRIMPMIDALLKEQNVSHNQIDKIAFGCGPGSFTGIRIAVSVAQGLGISLNIPLVPISSLAALAQAAYEAHGFKKLLVGVDARMDELYWGAYAVGQNGLVFLQGKESVTKPQNISFPTEKDWDGVGNAWSLYRNQLNYRPLHIEADVLPTASAIALLAKDAQPIPPEEAKPVYLRDDVAVKTNKR